jgi:hypothetical protein
MMKVSAKKADASTMPAYTDARENVFAASTIAAFSVVLIMSTSRCSVLITSSPKPSTNTTDMTDFLAGVELGDFANSYNRLAKQLLQHTYAPRSHNLQETQYQGSASRAGPNMLAISGGIKRLQHERA